MCVKAYGLPLVIETETLSELKRQDDAAGKALRSLPEDREGKVVYDFPQSPLGAKLLELQNEAWGRIVANVFTGEIDAWILANKVALASTVRAAAPGMPAASDKTYLGKVTMDPGRTFTVTIEHYATLRPVGTLRADLRPERPALGGHRRGSARHGARRDAGAVSRPVRPSGRSPMTILSAGRAKNPADRREPVAAPRLVTRLRMGGQERRSRHAVARGRRSRTSVPPALVLHGMSNRVQGRRVLGTLGVVRY
jgi:hypothetical protein